MLSTLAGCARHLFSEVKRGGRDLRHHEAGIHAAVGDQERRQAAHLGVDQQRDAPLGDRADLGDRQRQLIGRERHRLGVKIAARQHLAIAREHQRIVGHGVGLAQQRGARAAQQIEARAHHLRLAAQRVGVLHLLAVQVRGPHPAAPQQRAQLRSHRALPGLAPDRVDALIKRACRCP